MSDLLLDLVQYLVSQNLAQGDGIDCFRDYLPDEPDSVVSLQEYAGSGTSDGVECLTRSVQIVVRDPDSFTARLKIQQIFQVLDTPLSRIVDLPNGRWAIIAARQSPFRLGVDENGRVRYAINLAITTNRD